MIVVDVETTGLDPQKSSIVSIGAVEFENPSNQFYQECRAWPGAVISDEALRVNGFTREQVTDTSKPTLIDTICKFLDWSETCKELTLAGHNVGYFDIRFLEESLKRAGPSVRAWPFGHRTVDTHTLCYTDYLMQGIAPPLKYKRSDISLDGVLDYVGLPSEPKPHNALTGAKVCAEALSRIVYGKNLLPEYSQYYLPSRLYFFRKDMYLGYILPD